MALDAFAEYGTTKGVLYVHETHEDYKGITLPPGWDVFYGHEGQPGQMQWFFERHPEEPWYGWIADDMRPLTRDFDKELIATAGDWCMVWCNGGRHRKGIVGNWGGEKHVPSTIPSAMLWGGNLVRAVGWWAPPWTQWASIDEAWKRLVMTAGLARFRNDVVVEHLHWTSGLRAKDLVDDACNPSYASDVDAFHKWAGKQMADDIQKVKEAMA